MCFNRGKQGRKMSQYLPLSGCATAAASAVAVESTKAPNGWLPSPARATYSLNLTADAPAGATGGASKGGGAAAVGDVDGLTADLGVRTGTSAVVAGRWKWGLTWGFEESSGLVAASAASRSPTRAVNTPVSDKEGGQST